MYVQAGDREMQVSTMMHEVVHALGFSSSKFRFFQDANLNTVPVHHTVVSLGDNGESGMVSTNVMNVAKAHYGCNEMTHVEMENEGGAGTMGSHWERRILGDEFMTGAQIREAKVSAFTLAVFLDSGWYNLKGFDGSPESIMAVSDKLTFGAGDGCRFINPGNTCAQMAEFGTEYCYPGDGREWCDGNGDKNQFCNG
jgi:hypothetical protein